MKMSTRDLSGREAEAIAERDSLAVDYISCFINNRSLKLTSASRSDIRSFVNKIVTNSPWQVDFQRKDSHKPTEGDFIRDVSVSKLNRLDEEQLRGRHFHLTRSPHSHPSVRIFINASENKRFETFSQIFQLIAGGFVPGSANVLKMSVAIPGRQRNDGIIVHLASRAQMGEQIYPLREYVGNNKSNFGSSYPALTQGIPADPPCMSVASTPPNQSICIVPGMGVCAKEIDRQDFITYRAGIILQALKNGSRSRTGLRSGHYFKKFKARVADLFAHAGIPVDQPWLQGQVALPVINRNAWKPTHSGNQHHLHGAGPQSNRLIPRPSAANSGRPANSRW
ncbi:MAG: hypothetical protein AAGB11_00110 [Pseudomonadota bacterium]